MNGLNKLYNNLPNGIEKETINTIRQAIKPYIDKMNMKNMI